MLFEVGSTQIEHVTRILRRPPHEGVAERTGSLAAGTCAMSRRNVTRRRSRGGEQLCSTGDLPCGSSSGLAEL